MVTLHVNIILYYENPYEQKKTKQAVSISDLVLILTVPQESW